METTGTEPAKQRLLRALVLVAAGLGIYSAAIHGYWLWDDQWLIGTAADPHDLAQLGRIWFAPPGPDYWPLTSTLLWAQWQLFGNAPLGYHLVNLALHLLSGFLIWRLLDRLGSKWGWIGGLLFVIHPLAVESVAWISEVKNALSLPFFLLALLAWLETEDGKRSGYARSIFFYLAAMLSKTSVVMLPGVLLLYSWWKRGRITACDLLRIAPFLAIAVILGLVTIHFQNHAISAESERSRGIFLRVVIAAVEIFFYLGKFVLPVGLVPIYPRWNFHPPSVAQIAAVPALVLLLAVLWTQRRGWGRYALLGFGFFLLNLVPVLGLVSMSYLNTTWTADHFVYLPMIGLVGLVTVALEQAYRRLMPADQPWLAGILIALGLLLAGQSYGYAGIFVNQETFWAYTLRLNPDSKEAHNNLGIAYWQMGRVADAKSEFDTALCLAPNYLEAKNNLALALTKLGKFAQARAQYEEILRARPGDQRARNNLDALLKQQAEAAAAASCSAPRLKAP